MLGAKDITFQINSEFIKGLSNFIGSKADCSFYSLIYKRGFLNSWNIITRLFLCNFLL